jgi:hypothetical protein
MILKLQDYPLTKKQIELWIESNPGLDPIDSLIYISHYCWCHIVIVAAFLEQIIGVSPSLTAHKERLMKFHKVDYVIS